MKPVCLDLSECNGLGDLISATPTIKKIHDSYQQKITVVSQKPEIFKHNPFVEKSYKNTSIDWDFFRDNYIMHSSFYNVGKKNERGVEYKHNVKYVVIHPVTTWGNRTWDAVNWMTLTKILNERGIYVVSIGKDSSETGFFNVDKPVFNFEIEHGMNLMNKTSISDCWHIISKSSAFITMDSGLLHLAGTTDANIFHLGSSIKPEFRIPYRKGSQSYKYQYVLGSCNSFCCSNMSHGIKEWGDLQGVAPLIGCLEKREKYDCHPTVDQVYHRLLIQSII